MVDAIDYRILAHLLHSPWASFADVGRRVGISGGRARSRLEALTTQGVFHGWRAIPAAEVFGRTPRGYFFFDDPAGAVGIERVIATEDVVWATRYDSGAVSVLTFENAESRAEATLEQLFGAPPIVVTRPRLTRPDPRDVVLSRLDWKLIDELVREPRLPLKDLASRTGLSRKTVQARRKALLDKELLHVAPSMDESKATGTILFHAFAFTQTDAELSAARRILQGALPFASFDEPPGVIFFGQASSFADILALRDALAREPHVGMSQVLIPRGHAYHEDRVRGWAAAELARWTVRRDQDARS